MSTENKNINPEDDELSAILKRLSELLDTSVSLDEAVELAKNYNKNPLSANNTAEEIHPSQEIPLVEQEIEHIEEIELVEETESIEETKFNEETEALEETEAVEDDEAIEDAEAIENAEAIEEAETVEDIEVVEEEFATSKIFDELLACFDGHKLPDDFRFSSVNTVSNSNSEETSEEEPAPLDNSLEGSEETIIDEPDEEQKNVFIPIEHAVPSEEDELFSEIFSEEKSERKNRERDKKKWQSTGEEKSTVLLSIFDWLEVIVMSAAFALLLFTFVLRLAIVDGDSMNHTLHDKELLIISDLMYTPENNDIIVFSSPNYPEPIVKRIIATEGQTVDIDFQTWTVTVDGIVLEEDYINRVAGSMDHSDITFPLTVEKGHVFVMGDNRNESLDSRNSRIGLVDERYILGEVKIRLFPFNRFGKVD